MNQRAGRLAFFLLFLNIMMVLFGVLAMAWQSSRAAAHLSIPTNLAKLAPGPSSSVPGP